jgi:single-strand DNA-binding protein
MANLNRVFLIGNLTCDPELRYTPKGAPAAEINLAINRVFKTENGTKHEETTFVAVTLWERPWRNRAKVPQERQPGLYRRLAAAGYLGR